VEDQDHWRQVQEGTPAILARSAALPLIFHFLIQQFFLSKYTDIILKCSETFSERYGMKNLESVTLFESVPSCTAESSSMSAGCDFYKDDVNKEQLHRKIQQFLASNGLNSTTPNVTLKLFAENRTLADLFPNWTCLLRMQFALSCSTCEAETTFSALRLIKNYLRSTMTERRLWILVVH